MDGLHNINLHDDAIIVNDEATLKKEHAATNAMRKATEEIRVMMMRRRNRPNQYKNINMVDNITLPVSAWSLDEAT